MHVIILLGTMGLTGFVNLVYEAHQRGEEIRENWCGWVRSWNVHLYPFSYVCAGSSFCFGGSQIVRLGSTDIFTSAVVAHPGIISTTHIEAMKVV